MRRVIRESDIELAAFKCAVSIDQIASRAMGYLAIQGPRGDVYSRCLTCQHTRVIDRRCEYCGSAVRDA